MEWKKPTRGLYTRIVPKKSIWCSEERYWKLKINLKHKILTNLRFTSQFSSFESFKKRFVNSNGFNSKCLPLIFMIFEFWSLWDFSAVSEISHMKSGKCPKFLDVYWVNMKLVKLIICQIMTFHCFPSNFQLDIF